MNVLEAGALSFERFLHLCNDAEERFALSEENWKKIDDLAEHLAAKSFVLGNKLVTAMERFVGVYMATGGSEQAALDAVFASILLPAAEVVSVKSSKELHPHLPIVDTEFHTFRHHLHDLGTKISHLLQREGVA